MFVTPSAETTAPRKAPVSAENNEAAAWSTSVARDLLEVVFRYKWLIAGTFLATVLSTGLWILVRHDIYEVTAKVLIRFSRDSFNPRTTASSSLSKLIPVSRPDLPTELDLIGSYAIIEKVVDQLRLDVPGPEKPPPDRVVLRIRYELRQFSDWLREGWDEIQYSAGLKERLSPREKAIVEISESLSAETLKDSSIISVKLRTKFKEGAATILNTLVAIYSEQRLAVEQNPSQSDFLDKEVIEQREKLQDRESALDELKKQAGIFVPLPEQLELANRRVLDGENQLKATATVLAATEAKAGTLAEQLRQEKPTRLVSEVDERNALLNYLNERKSALVLERQKLLGKFGDQHPQVIDATNQVEKVTQLIGETGESVNQSRTTGVNPNYAELERAALQAKQELESARAQYRAQLEIVKELKAQRGQLQNADAEYRRLTRQIGLDEESYKFQQRNSDEFKVAEAMTAGGITRIAVVDKAVDPIVPTGLRKIYIIGAAVAGGLILAFGLAFICNAVDGTVANAHTLAREMGASPLAVLPKDRNIRKNLPPGAAYRHEILLLASGIDASAKQSPVKSFGFLACHGGAGVSTVTTSLAQVLSGTLGRKVMLVEVVGSQEAGIGGPHLIRLDTLDTSASQGERLSIFRGQYPVHLTTLEIAEQVKRLISRPEFDVVLLDVHAELPEYQWLGVASGAGSVVLVTAAEETALSDLRHYIAKLSAGGARVRGAVLNGQRDYIPRMLAKAV